MQYPMTIWKKYKHREDWEYCPLCNSSVKWIKVIDGFVPCDEEPVIFERNSGRLTVVKNREILTECKIYNGKNLLKSPEYGLVPHVFTCSIIKSRTFLKRHKEA